MKSEIFKCLMSAGAGGAIVHQAIVGDWGAVFALALAWCAWVAACVADERRAT